MLQTVPVSLPLQVLGRSCVDEVLSLVKSGVSVRLDLGAGPSILSLDAKARRRPPSRSIRRPTRRPTRRPNRRPTRHSMHCPTRRPRALSYVPCRSMLQVLHRALRHLLRNAAQATPAGGSITLSVTHEEKSSSWAGNATHRVRFQVADTGCGLPMSASNIFQRYYPGPLEATAPNGESKQVGFVGR